MKFLIFANSFILLEISPVGLFEKYDKGSLKRWFMILNLMKYQFYWLYIK